MAERKTLLIPSLLDDWFPLLQYAFTSEEWEPVLLTEDDPHLAELGLKYFHNELCYPVFLVAGQVLSALRSGRYDPARCGVLFGQAGDECRGSCGIRLLRRVLDRLGYGRVETLSLNVRGIDRGTGLPITAASDPVAAMTDMSGYIATSQTVKNLAIHLKKAADDLRLLNSGPHTGFDDLNVPARQAGSSIMPGKVNPVIPECVNQCCFMVFGMDTTVTWAASEGQLQLNAFDPVIIHELLNGIELLTRAMAMFRERCVSGITINASTGRRYAEYSPSIAAALNGAIGYEHAADIAQEAVNDNRTVRDVAGERTDLPASTLDELLDPIALSRRLGQTCREHQ